MSSGQRRSVTHLLGTSGLDISLVRRILEEARSFAEVLKRPVPLVPVLRGKTVATVFYEPSTRTKLSFELAAKRLSADVLSFGAGGSSVEKGESLKDTVSTIAAMGADCIVIRHPDAGAAARVASWVDLPVVNAGDGQHQHPTQALADAFALGEVLSSRHGEEDERLGSGPAFWTDQGSVFRGLRLVVVGDIAHSRVARSAVWLFDSLGARVECVGPPTLLPPATEGWPCSFGFDLDDALERADAVMVLRLQLERGASVGICSLEEYRQLYGLTAERADRLGPDVVVMHPGPVNRGVEIDVEVLESHRALVSHQVRAGLVVRMAVLYLLCTHAQGDFDASVGQELQGIGV